ncbi:MAG: Maf-like protein [Flavobacteriaceae bacterium]
MLVELLRNHKIILGSASPRRQDLLKQMGIHFAVRPSSVEEVYPDELEGNAISDYLAILKANSLRDTLKEDEILITSDTVVWHGGRSLAKPKDREEAHEMLKILNNDSHEVITSVCLTTKEDQRVAHAITRVTFNHLSPEEMKYYVLHYSPYDKAGAYGIQEWIGLIGIKGIQGSYNNVVGLPTHLVYEMLLDLLQVNRNTKR